MVKTIALFPGQGSQYVGMGVSLAASSSEAADLLGAADEILGFSLSKMMAEGPEEELRQTLNTQPALFVTSMMVQAAARKRGIRWDAVAGHSLGEYSAICAAGGFSFEEGLKLVRRRGELMARAGELRPGAMSAVLGLSEQLIDAALAEAAGFGVAVAANFNCDGQIVISGESEAVARAGEFCSEKGAKKVVPLPVAGAFHSPLMDFALPGLKEALDLTTFSDLSVPLFANVTAEPVESGAQLKELLQQQLVGAVRWKQSMERALEWGAERGIELGAGKVLMGLMRNISREIKVYPLESLESIEVFEL